MNICVYGASSNTISYSYIAAGEEFGKKLAESGHSLIYGGGANGTRQGSATGFINTANILKAAGICGFF